MFATACEEAWKFTRPVVVLMHCVDGKCRSNVASYVVVNDEGWILTAFHLKELFDGLNRTVLAVERRENQIAGIESDTRRSARQKRQEIKALGDAPPHEAPTIWAVWWGANGEKLVESYFIPDADLMLGRLEPFDRTSVLAFPSFKDPASSIRQGTSLCRLGFPFPDIEATYNATNKEFDFTRMNLPRFAIDGILTRQIQVSQNAAGYVNGFVETSSPGLKGQSGGPIVDVRGIVWGIQSRTRHLSLGFDPEVPADPKQGQAQGHRRKEHQFLNVGWGTHPATVAGLLRERGIRHRLIP